MITIVRSLVFLGIAFCCQHGAMAQTLAPRAYVITPAGANAITLSWSFFDGGLNFNGTVPITGATGTYHIPTLSYYHSFSLFGRSANITGFLPYGVGTFQGSVLGNHQQIYRSGLLDLELRFSVNLKGGRAMSAQEFANWKQKTLLGASLTVIAPTGQHNRMHLVNWGIHRWAIKPELGYSRRWGNWPRWVWRSMVLYDKQRFLLDAQPTASNGTTYRIIRGAPELRLHQTTLLGIAGRKFLVRRRDQPERHFQSWNSPD
jgi:hypothetical protein